MFMDELMCLVMLYYVDGLMQQELLECFLILCVLIVCMFKWVQDEGIVEICVCYYLGQIIELEYVLMQCFGIECVFILVSYNDQDCQCVMLVGLVVNYFDCSLIDDSIVVVGIGCNINVVFEYVVFNMWCSVIFVCGIGGYYCGGEVMNFDYICCCLVLCFGGDSEMLYVLVLVNNVVMCDVLLVNDVVCFMLDKVCCVYVVFIGVGDIYEDSLMVCMGWFLFQEILELKCYGVVGDMMGYDFINIQGEFICMEMYLCVIGLMVDDLWCIFDVIVVVSESGKVSVMLGVLCIGIIKMLVMIDSIVYMLFMLEEVIRKNVV